MSPIEVKSGRSYGTSSLDRFRRLFGKRVGTEYVVRPRQLSDGHDRALVPPYMSFCL